MHNIDDDDVMLITVMMVAYIYVTKNVDHLTTDPQCASHTLWITRTSWLCLDLMTKWWSFSFSIHKFVDSLIDWFIQVQKAKESEFFVHFLCLRTFPTGFIFLLPLSPSFPCLPSFAHRFHFRSEITRGSLCVCVPFLRISLTCHRLLSIAPSLPLSPSPFLPSLFRNSQTTTSAAVASVITIITFNKTRIVLFLLPLLFLQVMLQQQNTHCRNFSSSAV